MAHFVYGQNEEEAGQKVSIVHAVFYDMYFYVPKDGDFEDVFDALATIFRKEADRLEAAKKKGGAHRWPLTMKGMSGGAAENLFK